MTPPPPGVFFPLATSCTACGTGTRPPCCAGEALTWSSLFLAMSSSQVCMSFTAPTPLVNTPRAMSFQRLASSLFLAPWPRMTFAFDVMRSTSPLTREAS